MTRSQWTQHLASAGLVGLAMILRIPIEGWAGVGSSPALYLPTVTLAARYGGFGAGLVAVLFWALVWVCFDNPPTHSGTIRRIDDQYRVVFFLFEGMILTGGIEALNVAWRASNDTAREIERYRKASGRNEARLRAILEHSLAPIWMKDLDGRYLMVNKRFEDLVRRSSAEVVGRNDSDLALPPISGPLDEADRKVLEAGRPLEVEEVIPFQDGPRTFLSVRFLLSEEGGAPYAIGGILTDITELKEAQRRAVQAERLAAIGQMVAGLAHESRNALQRGQACLEMLAFRLEGRPEALELLGGIQEAQDDLHRLYEEVRCYAAPIRLDIRECRLRQVLEDAWDHLGPDRRGREARLVETGATDFRSEADRKRLAQVFRNVLDNALGACHDPVVIEAAWSEVSLNGRAAVRVAFRDNGPGLSPQQHARLFEPFYTTKTQGTGLGLAIARRIVEAHGGSIEAGAPDGPGAEIIVTLPRVPQASPAQRDHRAKSSLPDPPTQPALDRSSNGLMLLEAGSA